MRGDDDIGAHARDRVREARLRRLARDELLVAARRAVAEEHVAEALDLELDRGRERREQRAQGRVVLLDHPALAWRLPPPQDPAGARRARSPPDRRCPARTGSATVEQSRRRGRQRAPGQVAAVDDGVGLLRAPAPRSTDSSATSFPWTSASTATRLARTAAPQPPVPESASSSRLNRSSFARSAVDDGGRGARDELLVGEHRLGPRDLLLQPRDLGACVAGRLLPLGPNDRREDPPLVVGVERDLDAAAPERDRRRLDALERRGIRTEAVVGLEPRRDDQPRSRAPGRYDQISSVTCGSIGCRSTSRRSSAASAVAQAAASCSYSRGLIASAYQSQKSSNVR